MEDKLKVFKRKQKKVWDTIKKENCYLVKALVLNDMSKATYYRRIAEFKNDKDVKELHNKISTYGEMLAMEENNPIKSAFMLNNAFGYMTQKDTEDIKIKNKELKHRIEFDNKKLDQDKDIADKQTVIVLKDGDNEKL